MRIDIRVTVAGKMFCGRKYSLALQTVYESDYVFRNVFRIFPIAADIDDRIVRVVVYVENGRKYVSKSRSSSFAPGHHAHSAREFGVASCGYRHRPRENRRAFESHS